MSVKYQLYSPTFLRTALAYDAVIDPPVRALDILPGASGLLVIEDATGTEKSYPITVVDVPFRLVVQVSKIVGDGAGSVGDGVTETDISLDDIIGLV
jgi:hypothetical protein